MTEDEYIKRPEFESRLEGFRQDITGMANSMRRDIQKSEDTTEKLIKKIQELFQIQIDSINERLNALKKYVEAIPIKVGIVVTTCCTLVMVVFKLIEMVK